MQARYKRGTIQHRLQIGVSGIKDNDYLHFGTAKQRYMEFVKCYPDLALSVPQLYIASYLQITPQSLSRIRKTACL